LNITCTIHPPFLCTLQRLQVYIYVTIALAAFSHFSRSAHGSCVVGDQIFVVGGWIHAGAETNGVEAYDIKKNTWRKVASMNVRRVGLCK